jgi:hypothetical protein
VVEFGKNLGIDGSVLKCRVGFIWTRIGISGGFFTYLSIDWRVLKCRVGFI